MVVVATPVPPWFVKRPPFKFGDYPVCGCEQEYATLRTSSAAPFAFAKSCGKVWGLSSTPHSLNREIFINLSSALMPKS